MAISCPFSVGHNSCIQPMKQASNRCASNKLKTRLNVSCDAIPLANHYTNQGLIKGKQDNCQVAVSVSLACEAASVPVTWQLYLPREWADAP